MSSGIGSTVTRTQASSGLTAQQRRLGTSTSGRTGFWLWPHPFSYGGSVPFQTKRLGKASLLGHTPHQLLGLLLRVAEHRLATVTDQETVPRRMLYARKEKVPW